MRAALGGHDNITDPNGSKQVIECVGGDQIVPRIEGARSRSGRSRPTSCQKRLLPGSNRCGPQVVTASAPPGASCRHISATKPGLSAAKKTPKTHTTASNDSLGSPVEVASAQRNSMLSSPSYAARRVANSRRRGAQVWVILPVAVVLRCLHERHRGIVEVANGVLQPLRVNAI